MDVVFQLEGDDTFRSVSKEILLNLHSSSCVSWAELDSNVMDAAKDYLRKLMIEQNFDIDKIGKQIQNNGWNQERVEYFVLLLKEKKSDLFQSIITHHNRFYADTLLQFDWLLKLVLGLSESKVLRYPVLQVILSSVNTSGNQKLRLYEMNKESLSKFINILEEYQRKQ